jgi:3-mercaptopyruvate sulfurtransferase SseA
VSRAPVCNVRPPSRPIASVRKLKSPAQLTDAFTNAGVRPGDTVIMFAARTLGHPVVLYDGSFEDWARRDLPVENPSKK